MSQSRVEKLKAAPPNVGQENRGLRLFCVRPWSLREQGVTKTSLASKYFNRVNWIRPALAYIAVFALRVHVFISDVDIVHTRFPLELQGKKKTDNNYSSSYPSFRISRYLPFHLEQAFREQNGRAQHEREVGDSDDVSPISEEERSLELWRRNRYANAGFLFAQAGEVRVLADWLGRQSDSYYDQHGLNHLLQRLYNASHPIHQVVSYFDPERVCACRDACDMLEDARSGVQVHSVKGVQGTHYSCDGRERFKQQDMAADGLWWVGFVTRTSECGYTGLPEGVGVAADGSFVLEGQAEIPEEGTAVAVQKKKSERPNYKSGGRGRSRKKSRKSKGTVAQVSGAGSA
eukprot:g19442.t1